MHSQQQNLNKGASPIAPPVKNDAPLEKSDATSRLPENQQENKDRTFRPVVLIPTYNHHTHLKYMVERFLALGLETMIVDDGSDDETKVRCEEIAREHPSVILIRRSQNGGKGAAVIQGFEEAMQLGFSHCLQIDADLQHDLEDLPKFLQKMQQSPKDLVLGQPLFDQTAPRSRIVGRRINRFFVALETRQWDFFDTMIGFRGYPLDGVKTLLEQRKLSLKMDFDIEIAVRLFFQGLQIQAIDTKVIYRPKNLSNYRMIKDNIGIAALHAKLILQSIKGPTQKGESNRTKNQNHPWYKQEEKGSLFGLRTIHWFYKLFGYHATLNIARAAALFYALTAKDKREYVLDFQRHLRNFLHDDEKPKGLGSFSSVQKTFKIFSEVLVDRLEGWASLKTQPFELVWDGKELLIEQLQKSEGAILISGHFGNLEALRAAAVEEGIPVCMLMYTRHAQKYNRFLQEINPDFDQHLIGLEDFGIESVGLLSEQLEKGHFLGIMADRTSQGSPGRSRKHSFLGEEAAFPEGPFLLPLLLKKPLFSVFAVRTGPLRYEVSVRKIEVPEIVSRNQRDHVLFTMQKEFVSHLERVVSKWPNQWFNFYNFWPRESDSKDIDR